MIDLNAMGKEAKAASHKLATLTTTKKNEALEAIAAELENEVPVILDANERDVADARAAGTGDSLIDRLLLTEARISDLARDTRQIIDLPDPVGAEIESRMLPNGIRLSRRRIPIGVLGVIYEARPNVTLDIATLALKTGNATILRGGSETVRSNLALVKVIQSALGKVGLPCSAVQYIENPDRALVGQMLRMDKYIDMLIPRGGSGLHRLCREQSTIPVITGGIGICHAFVDATADIESALNIVVNSKVDRPSVCNALDTLLVHPSLAQEFLPKVAERLAAYGVELRAAGEAFDILGSAQHQAKVVQAGPEDFDQEWLGMVLGVHLVAGVAEAIGFIQAHTTDHTETIITNDHRNAARFVNELSSSALFVNASTRFNDGGQFGLGAEVAVSTQRLHARGPMGLQELTTYKWIGYGDGHIRE